MNRRKKKIIKDLVAITTKELLLACFDIPFLFGALTEMRPYKKRSYQDYLRGRAVDHEKFYRLIHRLKAQKYIEVYLENKEKTIQLTDMGRKRAIRYVFSNLQAPVPKHWDRKWRIVVFDIPDKLGSSRNILRETLLRAGFYKLQESVYVYPHECINLVRLLEKTYDIDQYVQYVLADRVETEIDLIEVFTERGILKPTHFNPPVQ